MQGDVAPTRSRVFVSYSHSDRAWLKRLQIYLKPIIRDQLIDYWDDTLIEIGSDWRASIEEALQGARIAILLVSANFLASDFIARDELPELLRAAEENGTVIMPLILRHCRFSRTPSLSRFQAVNNPERPLAKLPTWQRDEIFDQLTDEILRVLEATPKSRDQPASNTGQAAVTKERAPTASAANLALFDRFEWASLSEAQRRDFEEYLLKRLQERVVTLESVEMLSRLMTEVSAATRRAAAIRFTELHDQPDPEVRAKVAWEFRWLSDPLPGGQPAKALLRMLSDPVPKVADYALTSLAFFVEYDRPSDLWPQIDDISWHFWDAESEDLVDAAMFYTSKLLVKGDEDRRRLIDAYPRFLDQLRGSSRTLRERALWSISEFAFRLTQEQLNTAVAVSRDVYHQVTRWEAGRVVQFWSHLIKPFGLISRAELRLSTSQRAELEARRRVLAEDFLPDALQMINDESTEIQSAGLTFLANMSSLVSRSEHAQVLEAVIRLWRTDRRVSLGSIAEVTDKYVGEIPDLLAEQLAKYKDEEAAREYDIDQP